MAEEKKAVKVTITLKPDVLNNLDDLAEEFGLSRSGMITVLVQNRIREDKAMNMSVEFQEMLGRIEEIQENTKEGNNDSSKA